MTDPKAPVSDLDAAIGRLRHTTRQLAFTENRSSLDADLRWQDLSLVLDALSSQSQAAEGMAEALEGFMRWGQQQCPCDNDLPNPCPLCDASIENLQGCKAIEAKFPPVILADARTALSHYRTLGDRHVD